MPIEEVENFGHEAALGRPGQLEELAPAYALLASNDGSFITGSLIEITGGKLSTDKYAERSLSTWNSAGIAVN